MVGILDFIYLKPKYFYYFMDNQITEPVISPSENPSVSAQDCDFCTKRTCINKEHHLELKLKRCCKSCLLDNKTCQKNNPEYGHIPTNVSVTTKCLMIATLLHCENNFTTNRKRDSKKFIISHNQLMCTYCLCANCTFYAVGETASDYAPRDAHWHLNNNTKPPTVFDLISVLNTRTGIDFIETLINLAEKKLDKKLFEELVNTECQSDKLNSVSYFLGTLVGPLLKTFESGTQFNKANFLSREILDLMDNYSGYTRPHKNKPENKFPEINKKLVTEFFEALAQYISENNTCHSQISKFMPKILQGLDMENRSNLIKKFSPEQMATIIGLKY